jgi:hypothetical protein
MQPKDVPECVEIVATDPVAGHRYGPAIASLRQAWLAILGSESAIMVVFEQTEGRRSTLCGVGVAVFVQDDFLRELKTKPFWLGPELTRRITRGASPLLSDSQLREANSQGGLTVLTWESAFRPEFDKNPELRRLVANSFIENFRGFLLKEAIAAQAVNEDRLRWATETGGLLWDPSAGRYIERLERDPNEIIRNPYVLGVSREIEKRRRGTWIGAVFDYSPPRCGFSRAEQELLLAALRGESGTNEELAAALRVSVSVIKKTWSSIYDRAASSMPDLIPNDSRTDHGAVQRGKEKRRHLLAYLRDHPEELRPHSRKQLQQPALRDRASNNVRGV